MNTIATSELRIQKICAPQRLLIKSLSLLPEVPEPKSQAIDPQPVNHQTPHLLARNGTCLCPVSPRTSEGATDGLRAEVSGLKCRVSGFGSG